MCRFSHDLRNPSSSLLALAQILRDPAPAPTSEPTAQKIQPLAEPPLALADGFIALARAQVLAPERCEPMDLRDTVQDALDEVWASAQALSGTLAYPVPPRPVPIRRDRHMLGRALVNLLGNAIKYSPPHVTVTLQLARSATLWTLSVTDQGPGIAAEQQPQLFQRFRRALHAGAPDPGGIGLGLAFVRIVAQKHGGNASVA